MNKNIACIILAAGKGERMKSSLPKVLHPLCGRPMLSYVLDLVRELKIKNVVCVLGYKHHQVRKILPARIKVAVQKKIVGTADAVKEALKLLRNSPDTVLVIYGDDPLFKKETVEKLIKHHLKNKPAATLLTAQLDKPQGYGRIIRDKYASICRIVEEKDADDFQKTIKEVNTGMVIFDKKKLSLALKHIKANNRKKEYYLTDIIGILYKDGGLIEDIKISDINEAWGVNSRPDLVKANQIMQERINQEIMESGVTIVDGRSTFISFGAEIGRDTVIYPFTVIEKNVKIGKRCVIGPFIHLREGTRLKNDVVIGNFVEVVRSAIDSQTLAKHFAYLGDARIGRAVNIGAGTVTANFDGHKKNITVIKDKAFIGSDTILVAPVKIGKGACTGAGSVVLRNVPTGKTVVGVPARILKK
jgi:bifunctional UDP-N-acetylglucosamine pyrophosphorylase/glucosamine-1-phosphate N-acetyltransferase